MKTNKDLFRVTSYIPVLYFPVFYSFVLWAWIYLGYLPGYNNPDPKSIPLYSIHNALFNFVFIMIFISIIIWIITGIMLSLQKDYKFNFKHILFFIASVTLIILSFYFDSFLVWYAD